MALDIPKVTYVELDGHISSIVITNGEASQLRIQSFPPHIACAAQKDFHQTLSPDERRKLMFAQQIGEPAYTAVWDDLVSKRADDLLCQIDQTLPAKTLPAKMENGRDALTASHYPSYREKELERGR